MFKVPESKDFKQPCEEAVGKAFAGNEGFVKAGKAMMTAPPTVWVMPRQAPCFFAA